MASSSDSGNCIAALLKHIMRSSIGQKNKKFRRKLAIPGPIKLFCVSDLPVPMNKTRYWKLKEHRGPGNIRSRDRECLGNEAFYEMVDHGTACSTLKFMREPNEYGQIHSSMYVASKNIRRM